MSHACAGAAQSSRRPAGFASLTPGARRALGLLALAGLLASRLVAIQTVAVNWDEFALLSHARRTAESGILHGGGRPGLATLVLLPFAGDCEDEIRAVRSARLLWLGFTAAFLAGLAALLARTQRERSRRWGDALFGVALLACVPAFIEWSLQVRSDQIALAAGVWGGVALLASRRRMRLAPVAGALFALGWLATPKLAYVAALCGLLAAVDLLLDRELRPRRELGRLALCAGTALLLVAGFEAAKASAFAPRPLTVEPSIGLTLGHQLSVFEFYRETLGWSQYRELLPTLVPHAALLALLVATTLRALRRPLPGRERLPAAWAALALGAGVALFHAGAFAYFWMTLGLFPAAALCLARDPMRAALAPLPRRVRSLCAAGLAAALAIPALLQLAWHLEDTQSVQARSLALVRRNFGRHDAGFQPESALFCRDDVRDFPIYFSQQIYRAFGGEQRTRNAEAMMRSFEDKPVKFMLDSWRLQQFPPELRRFWATHYQPYRDAVSVAGRRLAGRSGERTQFELIVPGHYRWLPAAGAPALEIDGARVPPGHVIELDRGRHTAVLSDDVPMGLLVLALHDPPGPARKRFYKVY